MKGKENDETEEHDAFKHIKGKINHTIFGH